MKSWKPPPHSNSFKPAHSFMMMWWMKVTLGVAIQVRIANLKLYIILINLRDILSSLANPINSPTDFLKKANTISIYSDIKLSGSLNISGFGLVRGKNKFGQGTKKVKEKNPAHKYDNKPTSATLFASNYVYLLSHDTKLQSQKEGIQLKKKDFYGISSDTIVDEIYPKTQSMVRGESLKELLDMIVQFLVNHSHPFSQLPPYNEAQSITKNDITAELAQFNSKVLNPNIRINWYLFNKR